MKNHIIKTQNLHMFCNEEQRSEGISQYFSQKIYCHLAFLRYIEANSEPGEAQTKSRISNCLINISSILSD